ncbi:MAG: alpha/beta hydrolase [Rubrivivax sp.]|nr:alpha/beta hydrolase [Rubrivivax sp.]
MPEATPTRPPFLLVHGAWGGAWIWKRVLAPLRAAGHAVHAVTLTGDGERAHQRRADISFADHVADVIGVVDAEELDDFVLVGHSYGGMVITLAADRLLARAAGSAGAGGRPRTLVYVDAMVSLPGESWSSTHAPEVQAQRLAAAAANGNALPPPEMHAFGLDDADAAWLRRRSVPHPFGMYREPIVFDAARWAALPRWFIDCTSPAYPTIAEPRRRVRSQPGWTVREMATGHFPMVSRPDELVRRLLEAAG